MVHGPMQILGNTIGSGNVFVNRSLTVGGTLTSNSVIANDLAVSKFASKFNAIRYGFGGGPCITQGRWDSAGTQHTISATDMMQGADNVSGMLHVHVSSKSDDDRNGVATATVLKSSNGSLRLQVMHMHKTPGLSAFTIEAFSSYVRVTTDAQCSMCWQFSYAM